MKQGQTGRHDGGGVACSGSWHINWQCRMNCTIDQWTSGIDDTSFVDAELRIYIA
jgi:hypothetical protein